MYAMKDLRWLAASQADATVRYWYREWIDCMDAGAWRTAQAAASKWIKARARQRRLRRWLRARHAEEVRG
jgi:hypothetical protein